MRALLLATDAFGGHGGIALYNRDFLTALCSHPDFSEVIAFPRLMPGEPEPLPAKLTYVTSGLGGKLRYVRAVLGLLLVDRRFDLIVCGHLNLLPLAFLAKVLSRSPLLLAIYGIEAWRPPPSLLVRKLVRRVDAYFSISGVTRQRFLEWAAPRETEGHLLPNAIHLERFGIGPKNPELLRRYGLAGKSVLLTVGRLAAEERYKGVDEVLELMPDLPLDISYLVVGDGKDRQRLTDKAKALGLADRVIFAGHVPEGEKADHYRIADCFVMPSRGEGFGFVFLEAMACGVPVIGSALDGSREALRDGLLGKLVDPGNRAELLAAVRQALASKERTVPEDLTHFSFVHFEARLHQLVSRIA